MPNPTALEAFVKDVNNPSSPNYRKWLTPEEVGQQFGPSAGSVAKVVNYLKSYGITITLVAKSNLVILADATAAQTQSAFHTTINQYHSLIPNDAQRIDYYSFSTPAKVPQTIAPLITGVTGLHNRALPHPQSKFLKKKQTGSGAFNPLTTSVLYDTADLHSAGNNGTGRTVGISNWDGYHVANATNYVNQYNLPIPTSGVGTNISIVTIDGGSGTGPTDGEGDLDIQMVIGQAPLASVIIYDGGGDEMDVITREANDNLADTLTESYGWPLDSSEAAAAHTIHLQMSAQGQTYFCASGDDGSNFQFYPEPDLDPEVTVVGGTTTTADSSGNRLSEVGWTGSGGGWMTEVDPFNTLPSWQFGNGVPTTPNFRLFPDTALVADPNTGEWIYLSAGTYFGGFTFPAGFTVVGGTSDASPMYAAAIADVEQYLIAKNFFTPTSAGKLRFGELNPIIYKENGRADVWFDVTQGSDGFLPNGTISQAGIGWDTVTGWGPPNFFKFASTLSNKPPVTVVASTPITVFESQGGPVSGANNQLTGANANTYFSETSVTNSAGEVAATSLNFKMTAVPPLLATARLTLVTQAPKNVTRFVYLKNSSGGYDLITSGAMTGSKVTLTQLINLAKYEHGTAVNLVVRDVYPARLGYTPYSSKIYQATITESF